MLVNDADDGHDADLPPDPFGPGDPFPVGAEGAAEADDAGAADIGGSPLSMFGSMFGDLAKMMGAQGPMAWDAARQVALFAATDGTVEPNPEPLERIRLDEFVSIAQRHLSEIGGIEVSGSAGISVVTLTRAGAAAELLDHHRVLLERLASSLTALRPPELSTDSQSPEAMIAGLLAAVGPSLLGMQIGSMAGHLARRHFGTYDLPLPRPAGDRLAFIPANIAAFASDWSLPVDSLRMRLAIGELARHAVVRIPHISARFNELLVAHAGGFRFDTDAIGEQFGSLDPSDPASLQRAMSDPQAMLGAVSTPQQRRAADAIATLVTAIEGWAEHVAGETATRLLGGDKRVDEALKRRRIEAHDGSRLVGSLLGVTLDQALTERGATFVAGIAERSGLGAAADLWTSLDHLPTPAELDAPGLWLARVELQS